MDSQFLTFGVWHWTCWHGDFFYYFWFICLLASKTCGLLHDEAFGINYGRSFPLVAAICFVIGFALLFPHLFLFTFGGYILQLPMLCTESSLYIYGCSYQFPISPECSRRCQLVDCIHQFWTAILIHGGSCPPFCSESGEFNMVLILASLCGLWN